MTDNLDREATADAVARESVSVCGWCGRAVVWATQGALHYHGLCIGREGVKAPPTRQQSGSYKFIAGDVSAAKTRTLELPCLTLCGCGESHYGRAAAGIAWAAAHRKVFHPERVDRGQKARRLAAKDAPRAVGSLMECEL